MVVELPFITAEEIAAEYRPGAGTTVKSTLRRLREKELVSEGVAERPRGAKGTLAGALHVYSALNLDAARAARSDNATVARRLAKAAERIEHRPATALIVRRLAEMSASASMRSRFEQVASVDSQMRHALQNVAAEIAAEREKLGEGDPRVPLQLAFVMKLHGSIAELRLEGTDEIVRMSVPDLQALDSAFVGAALALRWEPFGPGQTLIKASPAIRLGDGDDEGIYPYERPLPGSSAPIALAGVLAAAPTMRRPRRIAVAHRR